MTTWEIESMNENQKKTTDKYRSNWDQIFKKKKEQPKEEKNA
jgi:hypothetical protein